MSLAVDKRLRPNTGGFHAGSIMPKLRFALLPLLLALATPAAAIDKGQISKGQISKGDVQDLMVQCAACHGADGIARESDVPDLAGQHDIYLYNQLKAFKSGKRKHKEMQYLGRHMTDEEMQAIASYYASLPKN